MSAKAKKKITKTAMKRKKPSDDIAPPTVAVTHSAVLNMVLSDKRARTSVSGPGIAANMLKAVQTATLSAPIGTKRKTVHKSTGEKPRLRPTTTTQIRSYAPSKSAKVVPKTKTPRVIGKEIDIRNQLLSKFTEVAAAKNQTNGNSVKKSRLCLSNKPLQIEVNNGTTSIQAPSSSQESANTIVSKSPVGSSKSGPVGRPKSSKTVVSPKLRFKLSPRKPCRQNIAFADPGRKVAGVVESMFSSAITKVLNTPPTAISKNGSPKKAQKVSVVTRDGRRSRRLKNKKANKQEQADSTEDEEGSQDKLYWGNDDDENSDNYEETAGNFNDVKIEIISDQQGAEYDYGDQSDLANLHGHQVVDMIVEDVQEDDEDPLNVRQSESTNEDVGIVKAEHSGAEEDDDTSGLFGGESTNDFENEEPEQVTVDVKPHLLPEIETETEGDGDETFEGSLFETDIKTENTHEDETFNDE